jgi:acetyl esterase/lipase
MACNEIPSLLLLVFVASIGATLADPSPRAEPATLPALALSALVTAALLGLQLRARSARPAFEAALTEVLGPRWRTRIRPGFGGAHPVASPWPGGILRPLQRRAAGVSRARNRPYGPGGRAHQLDVFARGDGGRDRPALIHLHGGGFASGGKSRESLVLLNQLARHGWVCVSANYRLRAAGRFPRSLIDTKRVIVWVKQHAEEYGIDPRRVFIAGASAGGHLALSAALSAGESRYQPGFEDADTAVAGVVSLYGYLGRHGREPAGDPVRLTGEVPPALIVQGAKDTALPPGVARAVADALRARSQGPVVYVELPQTQHGFDLFASVRARVTADAIESFLDWVRSE